MKTKNFLLTGALLIVALFSVNGVMAEGPVVVKTDVVKVFKNPSLSAGDKSFFTSTGGGMGLHFNVTYDHTGWDNEDTYKNMTNGTEKSIFTAEVTYTITTL